MQEEEVVEDTMLLLLVEELGVEVQVVHLIIQILLFQVQSIQVEAEVVPLVDQEQEVDQVVQELLLFVININNHE